MEVVACNLCASKRYTPVYQMPDRHYFPQEFFTVVECDECGLGFVNPRPTRAEIQKYYPPKYYEDFSRKHNEYLKRYAVEARYLREIEKRGGPRRLLDLGCANGHFLKFMMARGWMVEGVEVSDSAFPFKDLQVYRQPFPEIPIDHPTYDAITAWAVLEHLHDPMAYFQKASRVIKKRGLFVFLVNNFDSWSSRYLFCEDIPRHLHFFKEATVKRYLRATGFELEKAVYRGNIFGLRPVFWLTFFVKTRIKRQNYCFHDIPMPREEIFRRRHLMPGALSTLKFAVENPIRILDRVLLPVAELFQKLTKSYGVTTYVARKL